MAQPADPALVLRFGQGSADERTLAVGWSASEPGSVWTAGDESILLLDRPAGSSDLMLEIACTPFLPPGMRAQRVDVLANGRHAGSFALATPGRIACRIPAAAAAAAPRLSIALLLPDAAPRAEGGRRVALAVEEVRLSPASAAPAPEHWHLSTRIAGPERAGRRRRAQSRREAQLEPPAPDIERLRALLQEEPGAAAARVLDRILARRGGGLFLFPLLTSKAFEAVLRLGQADRFSDALAEQFGVEARIVVDREEQESHGAGAVLWSVAADGRAEFRFRQGLAKHGFATMIIDNWLKCLPAYARYLALPAEGRRPGRTWLNLEHMGTFPGVAFCDFRPGYQLMMDPRFIATNAYAHIRKQFAAAPVPWEDRRPAALWRGRLTGAVPADAPGVDAPWRSLPRARLCLLARGLGEAVDAGLTQLVSVQDPRRKVGIEADGLLRPRLSWADYLQHKYHIDIDGFTSSWSGLFTRLCTGGVVLKVGSPAGFRQWYYDRLVAWRHFVPVAADMADLADKLAWLRAHDAEARAIGEAGRELAMAMTVESETVGAHGAFRLALEGGTSASAA